MYYVVLLYLLENEIKWNIHCHKTDENQFGKNINPSQSLVMFSDVSVLMLMGIGSRRNVDEQAGGMMPEIVQCRDRCESLQFSRVNSRGRIQLLNNN